MKEHEPAEGLAVPPNLIQPDCESIRPEMLTLVQLEQRHVDSIVEAVPGGAKNVQDIYPLSPLQEGMLFHRLFSDESDTYVLSTLFELQSHAQITWLTDAFQKVIDRHDTLRTAVLWEKLPRPVQVVYRRATLSVEELELEHGRDPTEQLRQRMAPGRQGLNLRRAPLGRLQVADGRNGKWYALLQIHHLVCDHQSLRSIVSEAMAIIAGREYELPVPIAYRTYVAETLAHVEKRRQGAEAYFRGRLGVVDEPTAPFGILDVYGDAGRIEEARERVGPGMARRIRLQAQRAGVSAARLFHAAWGLVVARTSGREDVVYGTVLMSRQRRNAPGRRMLGMSVNTLPLRLQLHGVTARELVEQTHEQLARMTEFDCAPLTFAQRCSGMRGTAPLFTALLNYRHSTLNHDTEHVCVGGIRVLARGEAWSNYPVSMTVDNLGDEFELTVQTDKRIAPRRMAGYLCVAMESLVDALERAPRTSALSLQVLPEGERHEAIDLLNSTHVPYPADKLLHELFEEQVRLTPEAIAIVQEGHGLSYAELNAKANQLARHLRDEGIDADQLVALCMERSLEMLVGIVATLKAGGAYVPLDPEYPGERLAYMISDAAPKVLLTQEHLKDRTPQTTAKVLVLDSDWPQIALQSASDIDARAGGLRSSHLAYVIYTSGSTGRPKGVMIEHRHVVNLWRSLEPMYRKPINCTRVALNASLNFDASVQQLVQLLSGRTVFLVPQGVRQDALLLTKFICSHRIEGIDCTPSQLRAWIAAGLLEQEGQSLRTVLVGGEEIDAELWRTLSCSAGIQFYNVYGPTECTVDSTSAHVNGDRGPVHIGRPMSNRRIYILNGHLQPVPVGVIGEIYIGGAGIARGYLNRPSLTAERFVADPFAGDPHARMYKSGDLGRWRTDGAIEYLGRNDQQVKIRGYRIELGEIESQLSREAPVREAIVVAREDVPGEKRLVAYLTHRRREEEEETPLSIEVLRRRLRASLPEYMIPSAFVVLERLPLTASGKVDRRALPAPDPTAFASRQYEPPTGEVEEMLAGIWQGLLGIERIGRQDHFFELGGHSLLIVQMLERLRRVGLSVDVRRVFERPVLADLAGTLTAGSSEHFEVPPNRIPAECVAITPELLPLLKLAPLHIERIVRAVPGGAGNIQDIYPLTPLQEGILFHHLMSGQRGDTYIVPILLSVCSRNRMEELIAALQAVIDRHDILRTAVLWEDLPQPVQVVMRHATLPVREVALDSSREPFEQTKEWLKPERQRLDLRCAPLMRLQMAEDREGKWYAMLQTHHVTSDHVTLEILVSEVVAHLEGRSQELPCSIPYRNHVARTLAHAQGHDAEEFFRRRLGDVREGTAPFGLIDVYGDGSRTEEAHETLDTELALRIRAQARRLGVSAATLFHAAWGLVVAHTSGRDDVVFGSVLLGRLHGGAGTQRMLGMFINTLPLRLRLNGMGTRDVVEQAQRELVELLGHEQASLALAQRCSGLSGSSPLFTTLFNYRHSVARPEAQWSGAKGVTVLAVQERTNYPITVSVDDLGHHFSLTAQTDPRIDPHRMIGYLHMAVRALVQALEAAADTPALALSILPEKERHQMLEVFNATREAYQKEKTVHQLFEEQVARSPGTVAVTYEGRLLTYAELSARADQLAQYLMRRGLGPDALTGVCVERGLEMVIGLLGILKAGAAYVPLDPNYPKDRLYYMLQDAAPKLVLTQESLGRSLPIAEEKIVTLQEIREEVAPHAGDDRAVPESALSAESLVYVIYTSGSTGQPKGIAMSHGAVVNLIEWHRQYMPLSNGERVLQFAALSFDVAFQEIFTTLCTGGTLVLLDEDARRDARALLAVLSREAIGRLFVPPLMLQSIAECFDATRMELPHLRDVITAGEQLRITPDIVTLFERLGGCRLHNHYGPTETHVVTALTLTGDPRKWPAVPTIGRPIANTQIYVLDERRQPVPLGVAGEIYVGGAGLARGYLNRPELTAEGFLVDCRHTHPDTRVYKTGDLGRWQTDGTLEYLGRNDDQVKIRGFRIELGEIEAQLARHERVREAAVVAREDTPGAKRLVAYITTSEHIRPTAEELRAYLRAVLPEHMVPSAFVMLERLPLTPSGKLNRRALPRPELEAFASREYEAPKGKTEEAIAGIWQELLAVERVGRDDNFFEIGGHSLLVVKAVSRVNQCLAGSLKVVDVYRHPTIRGVAALICGDGADDFQIDLSREAALDDEITANPSRSKTPADAVMLTGATGFVGRFLLAHLLQDTSATAYCPVRARSHIEGMSRIRTTLQKWDLWRDDFERRIVAIPADLRRPDLGIDNSSYLLLSRNVGSIFHCGASMNHLETYLMAKPANVGAVRELLKLAVRRRPKVLNYISTLGVFSANATDVPRMVDEATPIDQERHWNSRGYVASKWVGEKIVLTAGERGIPCNIFRVGLVWADSQQGRYDELQHGYRLIKSCLLSGYGIENYQFDTPPIPVDYVARAIVSLASRRCDGGGIFHISAPEQTAKGLFERCNAIAGTSLTLVPFYDWISEIKQLHEGGKSLPIVPLVEFAFSMVEESFQKYMHATRSLSTNIDCARTRRELAAADVVVPVLDDDLLGLSIESMLSRDRDLAEIQLSVQ